LSAACAPDIPKDVSSVSAIERKQFLIFSSSEVHPTMT